MSSSPSLVCPEDGTWGTREEDGALDARQRRLDSVFREEEPRQLEKGRRITRLHLCSLNSLEEHAGERQAGTHILSTDCLQGLSGLGPPKMDFPLG